ncbi:MAG TPA: hypothetical protein P5555_19860 [Candidatus Paceibacterota bacterium]|nr:hypothetical protein [Candidatus Paceibacterota bacterium]
MKPILLITLLCLGLLTPSHGAPAPDSSLQLWLPLDEGSGTLAVDRSPNRLDAELTNVQWAKGAFGTAVHFGGTNAFIDLPAVPSLNGATQCTLSIWAMWEGTGRYPNLLTTHTWSPGGLMLFVSDDACSFRMGRPGNRAGVAGEAWTETGVGLLRPLPMRQWVHLCVVFALPNITSYVNGKPVGTQTWPYPVAADGLRIGAWSGPVSHRGLISDLRIYGRALASQEVRELAQNPARGSAAYTLVDESANPPPLAATFENRHATLAIDSRGRITSVRSKASGRELLARPQELMSARLKDGRQITARKASFANGALTFEFPRGQGAAVLVVDARPDFFTFAIRSLGVSNAATLTFVNLPVAAAKFRGGMANMLSDDVDAVCLRGYELPVEMAVDGNPAALRVWTTAEHGLTGWRAGLAAGPKAEMPAMLRAMTTEASVPASKLGGAWALGAEANRGSYLFADLSLASVDDWIELARRGGFTHIHLHGWWDTLGHYGVNTNLFPNGLTDMKQAVARIHAAGLKAGIHTLTACIDPRDAWVTPEASPHLVATDSYTLARPMSPTDTAIFVNEKPAAHHDVVFTYMGNGNAIRIGKEIVQYSEVVFEPPYAFAKCQRGAFKTRPTAHAAGDRADYLQQRYIAFYPEPGSLLANELAECIARVFNACQLDQIYFDGSEGMMARYGIDFMRHAIFKRLHGEVLVEASEWGKHNWWFHSRLGAWDHPVWAPKRFHDLHIASGARFRDSDLLEPQMGWWAPRGPTKQARGHFLDEMEYFGAKNLGLDSAMSIQGVNVSHQPLPFHIEKQFTVLGWYEQMRLARYFDTQTVTRLAVPGDEFRLRQDRDGAWKFTPVRMSAHRISALGNGSERWTSRNPFTDQPVAVRIEALYSVVPYDSPKRIVVVDSAEFSAFRQTTSSSSVSLHLDAVTSETRGGDRNARLRAGNKGAARRGAWARAGLVFPAPYRNLTGAGALGVWVKGDGKGALLNLQLATPREYMHALSDHHVLLDFTGWRYVELLFRERDVERMSDYQWPYAGSYDLHRNPLDLAHISEVNLYLNHLPAGDSTEVVVSPIIALPVQPAELKNPVLTVNSETLLVPTTLKSGDFIELEPIGDCAHYDENGDLRAWVRPTMAAAWPLLKSGENTVAFDCDKPAGASARAEVSVNASGAPFGILNPRARVGWKHLAREYDMPRWITAPNGVNNLWELRVRPGETARLEIELSGGMDMPVLTVNGHALRFPLQLKPRQRLICRDQRHWTVLDTNRVPVAKGDLITSPPLLKSGLNQLSFTCGTPDHATVRLVKVYEP